MNRGPELQQAGDCGFLSTGGLPSLNRQGAVGERGQELHWLQIYPTQCRVWQLNLAGAQHGVLKQCPCHKGSHLDAGCQHAA